jgi:hypothetical protein
VSRPVWLSFQLQRRRSRPLKARVRQQWISFSPRGHVSSPSAWNEAQALIESMHTRISAAALHQNVVAVVGPSLRQCGSDDGAAVAESAKVRMRDHVFEKAVAPTLTQEIRCGHQHACGGDAHPFLRHEDVDARPCERLSPHALSTFAGLDRGAHLRRCEQLEKRRQVGCKSKTRSGHSDKLSQSEIDVQPERLRLGMQQGIATCDATLATTESQPCLRSGAARCCAA